MYFNQSNAMSTLMESAILYNSKLSYKFLILIKLKVYILKGLILIEAGGLFLLRFPFSTLITIKTTVAHQRRDIPSNYQNLSNN